MVTCFKFLNSNPGIQKHISSLEGIILPQLDSEGLAEQVLEAGLLLRNLNYVTIPRNPVV